MCSVQKYTSPRRHHEAQVEEGITGHRFPVGSTRKDAECYMQTMVSVMLLYYIMTFEEIIYVTLWNWWNPLENFAYGFLSAVQIFIAEEN